MRPFFSKLRAFLFSKTKKNFNTRQLKTPPREDPNSVHTMLGHTLSDDQKRALKQSKKLKTWSLTSYAFLILAIPTLPLFCYGFTRGYLPSVDLTGNLDSQPWYYPLLIVGAVFGDITYAIVEKFASPDTDTDIISFYFIFVILGCTLLIANNVHDRSIPILFFLLFSGGPVLHSTTVAFFFSPFAGAYTHLAPFAVFTICAYRLART